MAVYECKCGFRGKDAELLDGKCPRCNTTLVRGKAKADLDVKAEGSE